MKFPDQIISLLDIETNHNLFPLITQLWYLRHDLTSDFLIK